MAEAVIAQNGAVDLWCRMSSVGQWRDMLVLGISSRSIADPRFLPFQMPRESLASDPKWIDFFRQLSITLPNGELSIVIELDSREPSADALSEFVLKLIELLGSKVKLIVLTDTVLPGSLRDAAAENNGPIAISLQNSRFNQAQIGSVFGIAADSECARNLFNLSNGLAGPLMFLASYVESFESAPLLMRQKAMLTGLPFLYADVERYLSKENMYDAVLRCAFLPEITADSAIAISGYRDCDKIIASLFTKFSISCLRSSGTEGFSWNILFRKFLLEEARVRFSPECVSELRNLASDLLTAEKMHESLFMVNVEAGDWGGARAVICDYAPHLLRDGLGAKVKELLMALPVNVRDTDPLLQYWLARSLLNEDVPAASRIFEEALRRFSSMGKVSDYFNCLGWASLAVLLSEGVVEKVRDWLNRLNEILEWHEEELGARSRLLGLSAILQGNQNTWALQARLSRCASELGDLLTRQQFDDELRLIAVTALLSYEASIGTAGVGMAMARKLIPLVREEIYIFPLVARWRLSLAECLHSQGDYDTALELLDALQEQLSGKGLENLSASCTWQRLHMMVDMRDPRAIHEVDETARIAQVVRDALVVVGHKVARIGLLLQQGEPAKALHLAQAAMSFAQAQGDSTMRFYASLAVGHALVESGDWVSAMSIVDQLRLDATHLGDCPRHVYLQLLVARVAMERSDHDEMCEALNRVFHLTRTLDRFCNLFVSQSILSFLCTVALESGVAEKDVSTAVLSRDVEPLAERLHERWPWRIRIYTLGAFMLVKDGETIEFSGKAQRRPLDLLKILIAYGGKSVDVNMVMGALWPDSQGDAAQKSFDTTLHRLRKLLADDAVTLTNRCVSLNTKMCWVDIWEFEQLVSMPVHSQESSREGALGREVGAVIDRVFQLYRGDFLCFEEEQQWVFAPADKVKSKFIRFVRKAGDLLEQRGNWSKAIEVYRRGIEVDNLSEDLYRALMESQRRSGSVADALETYRRCRRMLSVVLSITPSEKTTALYRQLIE
ncbi:tetratricopeptide repeat protein [Burkholderia sp. Ac-20345]|uniref:BTAD domain-containing putative transcriptional regulator n=1 Tax=Burkholderia sp. Ac-20345 TaxID=2703891 RepID=UPI00197C2CBD|nr:BTAD domain-containing putative transcriptional regulator [Burkholderia sp. Ac-20345]MBN3781036.1 tetratricopeptide repeat protein [Burkholderia sp. Ac-20345]